MADQSEFSDTRKIIEEIEKEILEELAELAPIVATKVEETRSVIIANCGVCDTGID